MKKISNFPKTMGGYTLNSKAFTLIELLVVIAIIGILAGVVIASLNSARDKGKVASIKSNLKNLQTAAILYQSELGTFDGLCNNTNTVIHQSILPMIDALKNIAGQTNVRCYVLPAIEDFGVTILFDGIYYSTNSFGVVTFDTAHKGKLSYINAVSACAAEGKRLPAVVSLRAMFDIHGTTPPNGGADGYYSINEISDTHTYIIAMYSTGSVYTASKTNIFYTHCVK